MSNPIYTSLQDMMNATSDSRPVAANPVMDPEFQAALDEQEAQRRAAFHQALGEIRARNLAGGIPVELPATEAEAKAYAYAAATTDEFVARILAAGRQFGAWGLPGDPLAELTDEEWLARTGESQELSLRVRRDIEREKAAIDEMIANKTPGETNFEVAPDLGMFVSRPVTAVDRYEDLLVQQTRERMRLGQPVNPHMR